MPHEVEVTNLLWAARVVLGNATTTGYSNQKWVGEDELRLLDTAVQAAMQTPLAQQQPDKDKPT